MTKTTERGLTRRSLIQQASGAGLAGLGSGLITLAGTSPAHAVLFDAYHGVTAAVHQANFNRLSAQKYRPISLSVHGNPPNVLYSAVWVARSAPLFAAVHNLNARDYQAAFNSWTSKGYAPTVVSATGYVASPIFAAVFEQGVPGPWKARHNMTDGEFTAENNAARGAGQILRWVSIYGQPGDRRYIAVWHANPNFAHWHAVEHAGIDQYQGLFESNTQIPRFRPACIAIASDHTISAAFNDESVGVWVTKHSMTQSEYQAEFERQRAAGRMPICVQGGGSSEALRYAAIFAGQDQPSPRVWSAVGPQAANLTKFDGFVRSFMVKHNIRAAQLTIAQNGVNKLQRAYTWAEADYHKTQVSDQFMLASNSKIFVNAAVQRLYDTGKLQKTSRAYQLLGFSKPKDPRSDDITVQQLLDHTAGFLTNNDPTYNMRNIALSRNLPGPARKRDIAAYMYARDLDYTPGSPSDPKGWIYNNYGYLLASLVVEQASGQDYWQFLHSQVLQPDHITEVSPYPTLPTGRPANLVAAEDEGLGLSAYFIHNRAQVPCVFGGDGMVKETALGSCGMAASATALTQMIHKHAVWGTGGRMLGGREGSTWGASSWAQSRPAGTDWALVMNSRNFNAPPPPAGKKTVFEELAALIDKEIGTAGL